ncbi:unnamed protein product [Protopolystoma xenopodis]|uniref:Uncharacterized protein n=1 Tax=Protopolystoma xenopodis TaxID=117903 RepID=A0A448XT33_9PLAT|nr:unnamed protein product [Protopolystoma xenopodis]
MPLLDALEPTPPAQTLATTVVTVAVAVIIEAIGPAEIVDDGATEFTAPETPIRGPHVPPEPEKRLDANSAAGQTDLQSPLPTELSFPSVLCSVSEFGSILSFVCDLTTSGRGRGRGREAVDSAGRLQPDGLSVHAESAGQVDRDNVGGRRVRTL